MYYYVFVEGDDDERYFCKYFELIGLVNYNIVQYAQKKKEKIIQWINGVSNNAGYCCLFFADADRCDIFEKVNLILDNYGKIRRENIFIVQQEIESWYLAGLDLESCKRLKIRNFDNTDNITKEQFNSMINTRNSRIETMIQIMDNYNIYIAINKNNTYRYTHNKIKSLI